MQTNVTTEQESSKLLFFCEKKWSFEQKRDKMRRLSFPFDSIIKGESVGELTHPFWMLMVEGMTSNVYRSINLPSLMTRPRQVVLTFWPIRLKRGAEGEALSGRTMVMPSVEGSVRRARVVLKMQQLVGSLAS